MRSSKVNRPFSLNQPRYFGGNMAVDAPRIIELEAHDPTEPLDAKAIALSKWVAENFDVLPGDDFAYLSVFGHGQFGMDA